MKGGGGKRPGHRRGQEKRWQEAGAQDGRMEALARGRGTGGARRVPGKEPGSVLLVFVSGVARRVGEGEGGGCVRVEVREESCTHFENCKNPFH